MKIAVITGASSGIGREFVYAVDQKFQLDEIWVIARRAERLEELKEACTTPLRPLALDLSAREGIEAYRAALEEEKPQIALLINAAGCGVFGPFAEKDLDALLHSATLNSLALTAMCHVSIPYIKRGGSIVNMGSNGSPCPTRRSTARRRAMCSASRARSGASCAPAASM